MNYPTKDFVNSLMKEEEEGTLPFLFTKFFWGYIKSEVQVQCFFSDSESSEWEGTLADKGFNEFTFSFDCLRVMKEDCLFFFAPWVREILYSSFLFYSSPDKAGEDFSIARNFVGPSFREIFPEDLGLRLEEFAQSMGPTIYLVSECGKFVESG